MRLSAILTALALLLATVPTQAGDIRVLTWDDLVPEVAPMDDPLADQPMAVRYDLGFIAQVMADAEAGVIQKNGPEYLNAMALKERLAAQGVDVDRLAVAVAGRNAEITRRQEEVNPALDGEIVRLPGYALPLEGDADGVLEFLLVPYVGACIHVPPPPPNQIVHAALAEPYRLEGLFEPVWITGRIEARPASRSLSFVDGQAQIPTGYTMRVTAVEPYEK